MGKPLNHRVARFLRAALSGTVLLQGIFASWMAAPLYALDTMQIGVTATDNKPPATITDLLASANPVVAGVAALSWTSPQGNVGASPIANWTVGSYTVRYATFSVDSLLGDTTSWWNAAASNSVTLQPPAYTPKVPGQMELDILSGLTPGTTLYLAIRSTSQDGVISPIDTESSTPGAQTYVFVPGVTSSSTTPPMPPSGLSASNSAGQFTLNWHPVTLDINRQPITIDHYVVYRYDTIGSSPTLSTTVLPNSLSYTDTVGGLTNYYAVLAVATGGAASALSDYMDSSAQVNRIVVAADDINTRVVIPDSLAIELNSEHNVYGVDLDVTLARRQQDEVSVVLRSYQVDVEKVAVGLDLPGFVFSEAGMQVQLGLGAVLGSGSLTSSQVQTLRHAAGTSLGSIAQIVSVYWFNGSTYVPVSDPILTSNEALSVGVDNIGIYQIRATQITTTFQLTQGSPYPRVITPNDPSQNNRVFWFFDDPSGDPVTGTIYDIRGAKVRDLTINSQSPTANSLVWDGHDNRGAVVRSGVYLYKIQAGKETQTGTVVVAR
jgi:hypothetical protein